MFSPTTTIKISIFQIPPPLWGGGIQITPDLQNINILSFSNFSDVNLIDSHPNNTLWCTVSLMYCVFAVPYL